MSDRLLLITGGNGGIAQHILRHLLTRGERNVVVQYRGDRGHVDRLFAEFDMPTDRLVQSDLCDESSVMSMYECITAAHGPVERLANVAGSSSNGMSWKVSTEDFVRVINDSLLSTFLCCKAFVPGMRERRYGRIVNFSSVVGTTGAVGASHYAAAKAGVVGFTKSLSLELASRGITANALALGYFDTGMINTVPEALQAEIRARIPAGRFGGVDDVGAAVSYLTSEASAFLTGQAIHLNGGQC
ncbi:MAG: SDR family oxidoreductase [Pseudomonadota bacterium]|nr:SDR family oxidoreductase [Pseudomonadota bacterium]